MTKLRSLKLHGVKLDGKFFARLGKDATSSKVHSLYLHYYISNVFNSGHGHTMQLCSVSVSLLWV